MGKKKKEVLDKEFVPFSDGMKANGYSPEAIKAIWDILVPFADYAFNKAHTASYGLVSYWTGYLKANYPAEYMAGLLTSVGDDKDKMAMYLAECLGAWASRSCRRTSTSPPARSRRSARTSASAWPRSATSATTWSRRSPGAVRRRATIRTSTSSCPRSMPSPATRRPWNP
nr:hypothetical protein GCM10020092_085620 [Actinoplanes digitatis]